MEKVTDEGQVGQSSQGHRPQRGYREWLAFWVGEYRDLSEGSQKEGLGFMKPHQPFSKAAWGSHEATSSKTPKQFSPLSAKCCCCFSSGRETFWHCLWSGLGNYRHFFSLKVRLKVFFRFEP